MVRVDKRKVARRAGGDVDVSPRQRRHGDSYDSPVVFTWVAPGNTGKRATSDFVLDLLLIASASYSKVNDIVENPASLTSGQSAGNRDRSARAAALRLVRYFSGSFSHPM
jgi:hypothetical protein